MRFAATLLLATALTAPSIALASTNSLEGGLTERGIDLAWEGQFREGVREVYDAPVLTGSRMQIRADRLIYDPRDDTVALFNVRFTDLRSPSGAPATASEMQAQGIDTLRMVNGQELCDPRRPLDLLSASNELRGLNVVTDDVEARRMGVERFASDRVEMNMRIARDGSCMLIDELNLQGVSTFSAERDTATIASVSLRNAYDGKRAAAFEFELRELTAFTGTGELVGSLGGMAMALDGEGILPQAMPADLNAVFDILTRNRASFSFEMREIFFEAPPEHGGQPMRGHATIALRHADGQIDADIDADIRGLARLRLDLGLQVLPESQSTGLSSMMGPVPGLAAAERLAITRLRFSAADQGFADIAEGATGISREQTLMQLRQQLNAAPQPLIEPVMGFATGVLNGGAGFRADPPQPVALTQLVMTGMLQPALLGTILAISPE